MLKDIIVLALVIFLITRILNRYIRPIFRITTMANDNMRRMQEQMKEMQNNMNQAPPAPARKKAEKDGDYIDYEEVK